MSFTERVKPTLGFLLESKRRLSFLKEGYELLKMKMGELAKEIQIAIPELERKRKIVEGEAKEALDAARDAYIFMGRAEMISQAASTEKTFSIEILPRSVMGVVTPYIRSVNKPEIKGKFGPVVRSVAKKFYEFIDEFVRVVELEPRIERLADGLGKTNIQVNSLEKIIIPKLEQINRRIEEYLEENMLEEFTRTKLIRNLLLARRARI